VIYEYGTNYRGSGRGWNKGNFLAHHRWFGESMSDKEGEYTSIILMYFLGLCSATIEVVEVCGNTGELCLANIIYSSVS
jgi:hypothetical protein